MFKFVNINIKKNKKVKFNNNIIISNINKFKFFNEKLNKVNNIYNILINNSKSLFNQKYIYNSLYKDWLFKLNIINFLIERISPFKKYKLFFLNISIHLFLFENTITLKNIFFNYIKYKPLKDHRRSIKDVINVLHLTIIVLQSKDIISKLQLTIKGKLGVRGGNKKKINKYALNSKTKYQYNKIHFYDGRGSSSGYGHTFMKIKYSPTYIK